MMIHKSINTFEYIILSKMPTVCFHQWRPTTKPTRNLKLTVHNFCETIRYTLMLQNKSIIYHSKETWLK